MMSPERYLAALEVIGKKNDEYVFVLLQGGAIIHGTLIPRVRHGLIGIRTDKGVYALDMQSIIGFGAIEAPTQAVVSPLANEEIPADAPIQ